MTDPSRLIRWMQNNYPPTKFTRGQIRYWMQNNVPAYSHMKKDTRLQIEQDWENFTIKDEDKKYVGTGEPEVRSWLNRVSSGLRELIRRILRRD